ncbi:MAG TPA: VCBS repeat-containing protein [Solirubrobacter sp.]|nr:VCBS repeat-containing protein [Solirubrobacter sp.]
MLPRDFKTYLLKLVVEWLSGTKIQEPELEAPEDEPDAAPPQRPAVEPHYERVRYEAERVDFHAQGVVTTADGRQIALELRVGMQREHYERAALDIGGPKAKDPLVLNFESATTALGGRRISFDLDLDGKTDSVALPEGGRFLALDRNGNGRFDDGAELFGARTGDGFAELAALDEDGDGWIDEDDAAFDELRVWDGGASSLSLREAGVGAIHVGAVKTPFTLGGSDATATGLVRSTGVWLAESGEAHTVQQIDIVIELPWRADAAGHRPDPHVQTHAVAGRHDPQRARPDVHRPRRRSARRRDAR